MGGCDTNGLLPFHRQKKACGSFSYANNHSYNTKHRQHGYLTNEGLECVLRACWHKKAWKHQNVCRSGGKKRPSREDRPVEDFKTWQHHTGVCKQERLQPWWWRQRCLIALQKTSWKSSSGQQHHKSGLKMCQMISDRPPPMKDIRNGQIYRQKQYFTHVDLPLYFREGSVSLLWSERASRASCWSSKDPPALELCRLMWVCWDPAETLLRPHWDPTETWDITTPRQQRQLKTNVFLLNKCEKFYLIRVMVCSVWSNGGSEARPQHNKCSRTFKSISAAAVFKAPLRRACPSVLLLQPENSTTSSLRRSWKSWWAAGWRPRSCIHASQTLFPHLYFPVFYRYWSKVKGVHLENPVFAAHGQF